MPTVTNGTVEYSRNVKVADYENKSFKVSLSFTVDVKEDYQAAADAIGQEAVAITHAKLGLTQPVQEPTAAKGKPRGARKSDASTSDATPQGAATSKPGLMDDEPTGASAETASTPESASPPQPVSDQDLSQAIVKTIKRLETQLGIEEAKRMLRACVSSFAPRFAEIPQEKRTTFLETINKLPAGQ